MDWWRRSLGRELAWLRQEGRAGVAWSLRITVAAVASYVAATTLSPGTQPLLAPLTAMLVVQVTPVSLLASGLDRVVAVVAGVAVAVAFAEVVPLRWWSLGLLILVSITVGQVLRLRDNLLEVAISGMLVLGVGSLSAGSAAGQRISETLVGAVVGVAANLFIPPKVATADAGRAIGGLADAVAALLRSAASELTELAELAGHGGGDLAAAARRWLGEARRINHDIPQVGAALLHAEQGRRLNVRAAVTPDVGPGLRQGLEAMEHSAVAVRTMLRGVLDATTDSSWMSDDSAEDVLRGLAQALEEMGASIDAFGRLVRDEADPRRRMSPGDLDALREALEGLHEARARLEHLVMTDGTPVLVELHATVLSTVKRLLREMDLDERVRRQVRLLRPPRHRLTHVLPNRPGRAAGAAETAPDAETQVLPRIPDPVSDDRGEEPGP